MKNCSCRFNKTTETYLSAFYCILEEMIRGMTCASLTNSISHNFIVQMIPHHRAAIRMSQNVLQYTADKTLQTIAADIIREQTVSIANMQAILQTCGCLVNTPEALKAYQCRMEQIMQNMFSRMKQARAANRIDCDFMWEMIPHHEGAVKMAKTTLCADICPGLRPILEAIVSSQEKGIAQMEKLLRTLHCNS